mgnify:CR=1 FL=1
MNAGVFSVCNFEEGAGLLSHEISADYQGSYLSVVKEKFLNDTLVAIRDLLSSLTSLDLVAPQSLRVSSRGEYPQGIGIMGEHIGAFYSSLSEANKQALLKDFQSVYPDVERIYITRKRAGWIVLNFVQKFMGDALIDVTAQHTSDGMLRIFAILAEGFSPAGIVCFDEIENGVNVEITEKLVQALLVIARRKQVIVTTHSIMLLNYLPDDIAERAVQMIYKTEKGETKCIPYFSLDKAKRQMPSYAPGDIVLDYTLDRAAADAERLRRS